ncbi:hypothetical protein ARMGADRAFT_1088593 [Armillaria gallica]|uniref:DUF6534 domain-containing protein n=1 Tax=Armillaria gallica TaxID=47427 RepID=A0A2H3D502_ARMGA|nr:hypothetical protein ARMGADRAFT_1088593 [Armillaria gallica]
MSSRLSPTIASLGDTFGALFVGATVAAILFGMMNVQVLIYYKNNPNDWSLYRRAVALFWFASFIRAYLQSWRINAFRYRVLDTVHVAISTHALYYYLINMNGNLFDALEAKIIWSMRLQLLVKMWTIVFVQGVYAIRLWKFGRHFHKIVPWLVFLAVVALIGAGIFLSYDIYITPNLASVSIINVSIYTLYSMVVTEDLIISLMMCYYLHKSRAAMCFSSMAGLLLGLIQLVVIRSGLATSAFSLFSLFTYIMWPETFIFVAIDFILPKRQFRRDRFHTTQTQHKLPACHSLNKSTTENMRHSIPTVLQFAPNISEEHPTETNVSLPLSEIPDVPSSEKCEISEGTVDAPV